MKKRILFLGERRIADMALELFFDKSLKEKFELHGLWLMIYSVPNIESYKLNDPNH